MRSTRNFVWIVLFMVMVFVVVSGGCGGSGGGSVSEPDNNAWDTDPYPYNVNQPENDNDNDNDDTGDTTPNPQPDNTGNSSPVVISGTWEIVSGYGISSIDISGGTSVLHHTYALGKNTAVNIQMSKSTYSYLGYYSMTLSGNNVIAGAILTVYYTIDEYPNYEAKPRDRFRGALPFAYIGNGIYQCTEKLIENISGVTGNAGNFTYTIKLENPSTLSWTVWNKTNDITLGSSDEELWNIILRKVQ
ncbi:MAG: hypothetical protein IJR85_08670 [Synergistaceae bacterium]|nr:hypothetical protein [Synergistaceae bacterium]